MHTTKRDFSLGILFAFINSVSLGILGIVDKIGSTHFSSSIIFSTQSVIFSLFFVSCFTLFYFKTSLIKEFRKISFTSLRLVFLVGVFASGFFVLFRFLGLTQSTGTFATLAIIITTALTAILATIFLQERLSKVFWVLFVIILTSMYFVSTGKFALTSLQRGDIYIIIGATFVAIANIFSKLAITKVGPVILSEGRFFFGALFLVLTSIFLFQQQESLFAFSVWSVASGLFWSINVLAFNFAIQRIGVVYTTSLLMTAPVYTMILEYTILKHIFNPIQIIAAFVVIISGILLVVLKNK